MSSTTTYIEDDGTLTVLPPIPNTVIRLVITNCSKLEIISELPTNLEHLEIGRCPKLHTLPSHAPLHLRYVAIQTETSISRLPLFSEHLQHLFIYDAHQLCRIDQLPSSLNYVTIHAPIEYLPFTLPPNLLNLTIVNSRLTHIPPLPDTMQELVIKGSRIECLPPLPDSMHNLQITASPLHTLPELPTCLRNLDVSCTQITRLPLLPINLSTLCISFTKIQALPPKIPENINFIDMSHTHIMYLHACDFANTNKVAIFTHALSIDQFIPNISHIHFVNPEFQILDLPPFGSTTVSFRSIYGSIIVDHAQLMQEYVKQKTRIVARTHAYKEELMARTWHTSRIIDWCGVNFDLDADDV